MNAADLSPDLLCKVLLFESTRRQPALSRTSHAFSQGSPLPVLLRHAAELRFPSATSRGTLHFRFEPKQQSTEQPQPTGAVRQLHAWRRPAGEAAVTKRAHEPPVKFAGGQTLEKVCSEVTALGDAEFAARFGYVKHVREVQFTLAAHSGMGVDEESPAWRSAGCARLLGALSGAETVTLCNYSSAVPVLLAALAPSVRRLHFRPASSTPQSYRLHDPRLAAHPLHRLSELRVSGGGTLRIGSGGLCASGGLSVLTLSDDLTIALADPSEDPLLAFARWLRLGDAPRSLQLTRLHANRGATIRQVAALLQGGAHGAVTVQCECVEVNTASVGSPFSKMKTAEEAPIAEVLADPDTWRVMRPRHLKFSVDPTQPKAIAAVLAAILASPAATRLESVTVEPGMWHVGADLAPLEALLAEHGLKKDMLDAGAAGQQSVTGWKC